MTAPTVAALPLAGRGFSAGWTPSAIRAVRSSPSRYAGPFPCGAKAFFCPASPLAAARQSGSPHGSSFALLSEKSLCPARRGRRATPPTPDTRLGSLARCRSLTESAPPEHSLLDATHQINRHIICLTNPILRSFYVALITGQRSSEPTLLCANTLACF